MPIPLLAAGMAILGGGAAYQENILSAKMLRDNAQATREYAGQIREYAKEDAADIRRSGFEQGIAIENQSFFSRVAQKIESERVAGAIRARAGASGADVGYGTPAQVEYTQRLTAKTKDYLARVQGEQAKSAARLSAARQARATLRQAELNAQSAEMQAQQMAAQAEMLDQTRGASVLSGFFSGGARGFQLASLA